MFLKFQVLPQNILSFASYFSHEYQKKYSSLPFGRESLFARYLISKYIGNGYLPQKDENGIPLFQDHNYWSLSHKPGIVFIGVSESQIGVDIEIFLEKSPELLDIFPLEFYETLGGKNWKIFYILWTSFESIQKMERWRNISVEDFSLVVFQNVGFSLGEISFYTRTLYQCKGKEYQVFTGFSQDMIYSMSTSETISYESKL